MSSNRFRFGYLCSLAAFSLFGVSARAGDITIPLNYDKKQTKNLEDLTIKFLSVVDKIVDHDGFKTPAEDDQPEQHDDKILRRQYRARHQRQHNRPRLRQHINVYNSKVLLYRWNKPHYQHG